MNRSRIALVCAVICGAITALAPVSAKAGRQIFEYRIQHPTYGNIGTYTNIVDRIGDRVEVITELHVAVKILGITVFRQEAERTERWQGNRMIAFHSVTTTNGDALQVDGEAQGNNFVITSPSGVADAPANTHPTNPWSPLVFESNMMMSTKTGEFWQANVVDSGQDDVNVGGQTQNLHRFDIYGRKHDIVWVDANGVTVAFEVAQDSKPVDFQLTRSLNEPEYVSADLSH